MMMRAHGLRLAIALALACGPVVTADAMQSVQRPVRDLRVEPAGAGIIAGIVVEDNESKRPLRRAAVRLSGEPLLTARLVLTADDGSFVFAGLPAGQYSVGASRASYMDAEYGAKRPGGSGSALVLRDGQRVTDIALRLSRWGVIRGVIYDQDGEPAAGVSVEALKYTMRTGRRTLSSVYGQPSTTDERGVYEVGGLAPGEYYIAAGPSPDSGPTDVQRLTVNDIDRVLQAISSGASTSPTVTFAEPQQGFAPVYFPGSTEFAGAQTITLAVGEDRAGVDIRLQLVRTARIDGTLTSPDGRPVGGTRVVATAVIEASSLDLFSPAVLGQATADAQGRFSFPAVAPGHYVVTARMPGVAGGQTGPLWAYTDVTVAGTDLTVGLTLQPGMSVAGKVVFFGTTLQPPEKMAGVRVSLTNAQWVPSSFFTDPLNVAPVNVTADGTFTMVGASPGQYRLSSTPPVAPAGWALRSAMVGGVDVLDKLLTIAPGRSLEGVVLTFTDRPTELSGTIQATDGTPTSDFFIVVFAEDRTFWGPSTRRSVGVRPASNGRYVVRNLPPGDYLVAAITDIELNEWFAPALLERLVPGATRVTLVESEKKTLDLKIAGGDF